MKANLILKPKWLVAMHPQVEALEGQAVVINDGIIVDVLPADEASSTYEADETLELSSHVLMPGLVNAHTHSPMTLFRGMADDLQLMTWLQEHIWPAEQKMNEDFISVGTELAVAEMLRSGTTCFNEHYFYPGTTAEVAIAAGMRAQIGVLALDVPTPWAQTGEESITKGLNDLERVGDYALVTHSMAPHAPYTVSDDTFKRMMKIATDRSLTIHIHMHETQFEVDTSMKEHGKRPMQRFADLGLLEHHMQLVHMTALNDEDISLIKGKNCHVIHSPESNLKLASGYCPVQKLLDAGVNVGLGTDGAASNNDLDMFGEMRTASLIGKMVAQDPTAVSAKDVLSMATLGSAKALGLDDKIGSLEKNKAADMIAVDLSALNTQPVYHPISHLVYAVNSQQVTDVWVAGQRVLKDTTLTTIDTNVLIEEVGTWKAKIVS